MSEVNFGANQTPVNQADETAAEKKANELESGGKQFSSPAALAMTVVPGVGLPAASDAFFTGGDFLPGFKDIILPRIGIVQGMSQMKDSFAQGAIVFDQKLELFRLPIIEKATGNVKTPGTKPVEITIVGFRPTRFVEKVQGGGRGQLVNTEAEVRANGGTLDYNEWVLKRDSGMKRFETLAEAFILIKRPEGAADDGSVFTFRVGADSYALALWGMKGSSYTQCAKRVFFTARKMGCLSKGYSTWNYSLSTRTATYDGNTYFVPVAIPNAPTTLEVASFIAALLNPAPAAAE